MIVKYYEPDHRQPKELLAAKMVTEEIRSLFRYPCSYSEQGMAKSDEECNFCEHSSECSELLSIEASLVRRFDEPYVVCSCVGAHKDTCLLGEAGRKIRRRLEDRLRKDVLLTLWVSRIIGLIDSDI